MSLSNLRSYFLWTTVLACLWIAASSWLGLQLIGVLGSVVFMGLYVVAYHFFGRATNHDAHLFIFANSLYFQGFLLTVWALIISLLVWGAAGTVELVAGDVLSRIGIALITTFIGLGGRTLYIQFYESTDDVRVAAEFQLSDKSSKLAAELSQAINNVREARSELIEEIGAMREGIQAARKEQQKSAAATADALARVFHRNVNRAIEAITEPQAAHAAQLKSTTSALGKAAEYVAEAGSEIRESAKELNGASANQAAIFRELLAKQLEQLSEASEKTNQVVLDRVYQILDEFREKIQNFAIDESAITDSMRKSYQRIDPIIEEMRVAAEGSKTAIEQAQFTISSIAGKVEDVAAISEAAMKVSTALDNSGESMRMFESGIRSFSKELEDINAGVAKNNAEFGAEMTQTVKNLQTTSEMVREWEAMAAAVKSEIGTLAQNFRSINVVSSDVNAVFSDEAQVIMEKIKGTEQSIDELSKTLEEGARILADSVKQKNE